MITRRNFIRSGLVTSSTLVIPPLLWAESAADPAPVISVRRKGVLNGSNVVSTVLKEMVDTGVKALTGENGLAAAWTPLIPGLSASSKILIKPVRP